MVPTNKKANTWAVTLLGLLALGLTFGGCSDEDNPAAPPDTIEGYRADCIGCHTNEAMLRAVAVPDTAPPGDPSGEG
ncbi:hypothetical protein KKH27_00145 [bacterium]|nr:hypothetical protein [bacterium]MBU1984825.1 hypothetical protein [bacterium]